MIIAILVVLGLCFGSFVNALVYRVHEQSKNKKQSTKSNQQKAKHPKRLSANSYPPTAQNLSILSGRSMCINCKHTLAWYDLLPVLSWLRLKGKCRYCQKPISWHYPLVELAVAVLFVISYLANPLSKVAPWNFGNVLLFGFWLVLLTGFMALVVYDLKWYLLPNRIVYPLLVIGALQVSIQAIIKNDAVIISQALPGVAIGGGLFYLLFQVSDGRWIGGGDVKLGFLLGLVLGDPVRSLLMIFLASLLGSLVTIPLLLSKKVTRSSHIPFGPFLILAAIVVQLYGTYIWDKYQYFLIPIG